MKIKVSFFGVLMIISLVLTHSYVSLAALLAAFLHELGHVFAAKLCKIPLKEFKLDIFGAVITTKKSFCSYKNEVLLAISGPAVNIISTLILLPNYQKLGEFGKLFVETSCFLGLLNLLPLEGFDGGRILNCVLSATASPYVADRVCKVLSFVISFFMWFLSVYLLLKLSASLSLFVFSYAFLCKMLVSAKQPNK